MSELYTCKDHTEDYDFCPICKIEQLRDALSEMESLFNPETPQMTKTWDKARKALFDTEI